jgi:cell division protein DivIC
MLKRLPPVFRNFYVVATFLFLIWMIFLDSNDFINRYRLSRKIGALESEKEYYQERIAEVERDRTELTTNKELLEKFAREKYLMKKKTEDIFIIQEE